ncbi:hypothetical protein M409DRAFT_22922 [Zasmidium cellare ATCC 36951]|uniref:Uncharacterized protein n=1 Tax=Zasmidium cellare ATCC 36951 TaxID=1080233 RepID=A0A6A6CMA2_ZASCE|nr:uncharacterized protein M409DRAFT_22922 [Zasmidium cellare ATCC 36951]KAF2166869.1 hypothetical protein M409DRAFT_22922 [Zasmidium cellare ATCC 36951]
MRLTHLLPLLTATTTTLAAPLPQDIALLGMCVTGRRGPDGHKTCHDGPGLFTSLFASGPGAAAANAAGGGGRSRGMLRRRGEEAAELGIGGLLGNLPVLSSLFGMGDQSKKTPSAGTGTSPSSSSGGGGGGGLGGLGLKKERRGEEAGIGDLFSSLPLVGSLLGGGKPKNSPSTPSPQMNAVPGAVPGQMGGSGAGAGAGMTNGRKQHLGGMIGI